MIVITHETVIPNEHPAQTVRPEAPPRKWSGRRRPRASCPNGGAPRANGHSDFRQEQLPNATLLRRMEESAGKDDTSCLVSPEIPPFAV